MKIQNPNMAGMSLGLRHARDKAGNPVSARGDDAGIFDVPEKDAKMLLGTVGWSRPKKARPLAAAPAAAPAPEPVEVEVPPEPAGEEEELDLDSMDKDALAQVAERYEVEVNPRWGEKRLRKELEDTIFEEG